MSDSQSALRAHVLKLLEGGSAHVDFAGAMEDFPAHQRGAKPAGAPYSAWQLLEHLRIAQEDILAFSRDAAHVSPKWPEGYWTDADAPPSEAAWDESIRNYEEDLNSFAKLISDPANDLLLPLANAPDAQTLLREALVLADHNSYHLGQIVLLRKVLGAWE